MEKGTQGDPLVKLAKSAVEEYVKHGKVTSLKTPVPVELSAKAGAFVCLKKKGQLRGCIGTIEAMHPDLSAEIIENAISAATRDPRFFPVEENELESLEYSVDVLSEPEPVYDIADLDPKIYGVIVESGYKRGVLLPDLEGVDTVDDQLNIAMSKAGIHPDEPVQVYRFKVIRHT